MSERGAISPERDEIVGERGAELSGAVCCDFERGSEHPRERGAGILTAQLRSHALAPGKTLVMADKLSRSPQTYTTEETGMHADVECYVAVVMQGIPATPHKMDCIKAATAADGELQTVIKLIREGWPQQWESNSSSSQGVHGCKSRALRARGLSD